MFAGTDGHVCSSKDGHFLASRGTLLEKKKTFALRGRGTSSLVRMKC